MILIVDHYDSYTQNIVGLCHLLRIESTLTQCTDLSNFKLDFSKYRGIILSPGPGHPSSCQCRFLLQLHIPILGICLGFQLICMHFGLEIVPLESCKHGTSVPITLTQHGKDNRIFRNIPDEFQGIVYNSLHAVGYSDYMIPLAFYDDVLQSVAVKNRHIYGVQYHPESILSEYGIQLFKNFFSICQIPFLESLMKLKHINQFNLNSSGLYKYPHHFNCTEAALSLYHSQFADEFGFLLGPWTSNQYLLGKYDDCISFEYNNGNLVVSFNNNLFNSHFRILDIMCVGNTIQHSENRHTISLENIDFFKFITNIMHVLPEYSKMVSMFDYELKEFTLEDYNSTFHGNATVLLALDHMIVDSSHVYSTLEMRSLSLKLLEPCFQQHGIKFNHLNKNEYCDKVVECQDYIRQGDTYELNFTTQLTANLILRTNRQMFNLYKCLHTKNKAPYSAFINLKDVCIFCTSPEKFIDIVQDTVTMKPIKGTLARNGNDQQEVKQLKQSQKDIAENLMIVDLIRNDLTRICEPNSVYCPRLMEIETYASVHQMVSTVCGIKNTSIGEILKSTFPTGSMTGAPKKRSVEILEKLEVQPRGLYAGSIGMFQQNEISLNVVIRTAIYDKNRNLLSVGAGGAITIQSEPEAEYEEMLVKANSIFRNICCESVSR